MLLELPSPPLGAPFIRGLAAAAALALGLTAAAPTRADGEFVPDWLAGPPDERRLEERAGLYACMIERAEARTGSPLEEGSLSHRRLVSAVNKAVTDWEETGGSLYEEVLPDSDVSGLDPVHFAFGITGAEIEAGRCR
ncbi:hypothetical protein [Jannaschia formosa]|uniref:hypothetical protein n=1 Tax=Jannaschia formosa TaxID=2259592 RepID=UPI000E1C18A3|nr:hypothetical protein [Jannaschia formosa]TFL15958.1 hypothetical protein DR046_22615 [Jannaschia formosa]